MISAFRLLPVALAVVAAASASVRAEASPAVVEVRRAFSVKVVGSGQRPMVLIPGLLSSGDVWDSLVAHYASSHRLHVVTLAGFAGVPPLADDGASLLSRVRDDLIAYIRAERLEKSVLVGHSLGATLALWVASVEPALVGPVVAVDGAPFAAALANPSIAAADMTGRAEQLRALYRSLTPEQLEMQTRMALQTMVTDAAHKAVLAEWATHSDPATAGRALFDVMTIDLRPHVRRIESTVLVVAAGKAFASRADGLDAVRRAYVAQLTDVPRHTVLVAERALHFVMLDDPAFLLAAMDEFLVKGAAR